VFRTGTSTDQSYYDLRASVMIQSTSAVPAGRRSFAGASLVIVPCKLYSILAAKQAVPEFRPRQQREVRAARAVQRGRSGRNCSWTRDGLYCKAMANGNGSVERRVSSLERRSERNERVMIKMLREISALGKRIDQVIARVEVQGEEIRAQGEQLRAQGEELKAQGNELKAQGARLDAVITIFRRKLEQ